MSAKSNNTEIIAVCSGKGGTGKTLIASCLGYALIRAGHNVLMIDGDPATSGMSLFLLGPKGMRQAAEFTDSNTFVGLLKQFQRTGDVAVQPRTINRAGSGDHGVVYEAIICTNSVYGESNLQDDSAVPDLDQSSFRAGIRRIFDSLREVGQFNYIIIDTRGGFAFESTDVCALADSFILVTEPTISSFYQDRNLVQRINQAANQISSRSVLRAVIVNKATDIAESDRKSYLEKLEFSFRNEITKEFLLDYSVTHAVPADLAALHAYKEQSMPYISAPASMFSYSTLSAFSDILQVVTSRWSREQVNGWNILADSVLNAVDEANQRVRREKDEVASRERELIELRAGSLVIGSQIEKLKNELAEREAERTFERDSKYRSEITQSASKRTRSFQLLASIALTLLIIAGSGSAYIIAKQRRDQAIELDRIASQNKESLRASQEAVNIQLGELRALAAAAMAQKNSGEAATKSNSLSLDGNDPMGNFAVVLSNDVDLLPKGPGAPSASFEAQLAIQSGCDGVTLYKKQNLYQTIVPFDTQANALKGLKELSLSNKSRWRTPYVQPLNSWCPKAIEQAPISVKGFSIPVRVCASPPKP